MENEFSDRLNQLLSDPDMMGKVLDAAKNVMGAVSEAGDAEENGGAKEGEKEAEAVNAAPLSLLSRDPAHDAERIRLIRALCPFLSRTRRDAAESMIRVLSVMRVMRLDGKGGEE